MSKEEEGYQASNQLPQYHYITNYSINDLSKARILQKTVVYVIGLSSVLANKEILIKNEYFGQYGPIVKVVVNRNGYAQSNQSEMTYSAFVTFSSPKDASLALLAIDNTEINGHVIRCSFGTTKYCSFFLKNMECINKECLYLHSLAEEEETLFKEESYSNKIIFFKQQKIAMRIANIHYKDFRPKNYPKVISSGFPSINSLYYQECNTSTHSNRKYSEYDSYSHYYHNYHEDFNDNQDVDADPSSDDENVEYVLVKEPSSKRRKWKQNQQTHQQSNEKESKKRKRNFTLEDIKVPTKQEDEIFTSASSSSTSNSNKQVTKDVLIGNKKYLFNTAIKSRFEFVNNETNKLSLLTLSSPSIDIPQFILDMVNKTTSSLIFFKQFDLNNSDILIEEANQIISWNSTSSIN